MVRPKIKPFKLLVSWLVAAAALFVAAWIVPHVEIQTFLGAVVVSLVIAVLNALVLPVVAAIKLPLTLVLGFLIVLVLDALMLLAASALTDNAIEVDSFWWALLTALIASAVTVVLDVLFGTNDDDTYTLRVIERIARRSGERVETDVPGIVFLEIDGLALPVLQRAMRDGNAPNMARWVADGDHRFAEWEPDLSSQTGASQAGILLGSNENIPAFRWVEKATATMMTCSAPADCAELERRHSTGVGLLADGGASRGNLLSGEADHVILTVSRIEAGEGREPRLPRVLLERLQRHARPRAVLLGGLPRVDGGAARDPPGRPPEGASQAASIRFMRAAMCVVVRDLIVYGVLSDMLKGRPAIYATFSSYDEVAHHSGLERADTLEALRKLDQQFGRIDRARRYSSRPYEIVVLSDHGQTQGATFKQRNGYGLEELVERSLTSGEVTGFSGGDEQNAMVGLAVGEATGTDTSKKRPKNDVSDRAGRRPGLGKPRAHLPHGRATPHDARGDRGPATPRSSPRSASIRTSAGSSCARRRTGRSHSVEAVVRYLADDRVEGDDPLADFSPTAAHHLRRTDGFADVADIMVGSFYDPQLDEGCAFEELISFHGGLGGPQTRPFVLYPASFPLPDEPIIGAAAVHGLLRGWRQQLQGAG